MGQKISPTSLRLVINKDWRSRWFSDKHYKDLLKGDLSVRDFLEKKLKNMGVDRIDIERSPNMLQVIIHTSRPGLIIGRGGNGIEEIRQRIQRMAKIRTKSGVRIDVQEVKNPEASAKIMAEAMAEQLEKRLPYRRLLKQTLAKIGGNKEVKGVKLAVAGRLDGNDIARTEHLEQGSLPLQTLRADIDYAQATAHTTFGTVGIKVWIFKGLKF